MKRALAALPLLALLLAAPILAGGGAQTYSLRRTPKFKVGDRIKVQVVENELSSAEKTDGGGAQKSSEKTSTAALYEVLTVDRDGRVLSFRKTLLGGEQRFEDSRFRKPVEVKLGEVFARGKPRGKDYTCDPATLRSAKVERLDAPQVALVREEFCKRMSFAAQRPADSLLMPAGPVEVGRKWKLEEKQLRAWLRAMGRFAGPAITPRSGLMRLSSVKKNLARIDGTIKVEGSAGGHRFNPVLRISMTLDLAAGLWREREVHMVGEDTVRGVKLRFVASRSETATVLRSRAARPAPRGKTRELGWPDPGVDANRFASGMLGVSIDAPPGHKHTGTTRRGRTISIRFMAANKSVIGIHMQRFPYPLKLKTSVDLLERSLTGGAGTRVTARRKLRLPLGQPAMLIETESKSGLVASRLLIAADGKRIVGVNAAAPKRDAKQVAAIDRALRSLRLYDPNPFSKENGPAKPEAR